MSLVPNPIPILEYDSDPGALLRHDRHSEIILPKKAVYAFLGDTIDDYARDVGAEILDVFHTIGRDTNIYRIRHKGEDLCLCRAPLGGPAAVQLLDWLIGHGVRAVVTAGSCGALAPLPENAFLIPERALRDEGTSYHYLPPARFVELSPEAVRIIRETLHDKGLASAPCTTWTTDGFFRETEAMVRHRREEGCLTVEMECASLAACAQFRGVLFGQLLYTADSLADAAHYDERSWGKDSLGPALELCLEIIHRFPAP